MLSCLAALPEALWPPLARRLLLEPLAAVLGGETEMHAQLLAAAQRGAEAAAPGARKGAPSADSYAGSALATLHRLGMALGVQDWLQHFRETRCAPPNAARSTVEGGDGASAAASGGALAAMPAGAQAEAAASNGDDALAGLNFAPILGADGGAEIGVDAAPGNPLAGAPVAAAVAVRASVTSADAADPANGVPAEQQSQSRGGCKAVVESIRRGYGYGQTLDSGARSCLSGDVLGQISCHPQFHSVPVWYACGESADRLRQRQPSALQAMQLTTIDPF